MVENTYFTIIGGVLLVLAMAFTSIGQKGCDLLIDEQLDEEEKVELKLASYPKLFKEDVLLVVADEASHMELESSGLVTQKLAEVTENEILVRKEYDISKDDRASYNLILIGTPRSNSLFEEVYEITDVTRVTKEYPGENMGILEVLRNPWNSERALLMICGYNELGVRAAVVNFTCCAAELDVKSAIVLCLPVLKWPFNNAVTSDDTIAFGWYNIEGIQKYLLQVDNDQDFSSPEIEAYAFEAQFEPSTPLASNTYY